MTHIDAGHHAQVERAYRAALQTVESSFGKNWLDQQANRQSTTEGAAHPVIPVWKSADAIGHETSGFADAVTQLTRLAELVELSGALATAKGLKGFQSEVPQALLQSTEAASHLYAVSAAAFGISSGFHVEFIRRGETKTADLLFRRCSREYHVECKKRALYMERPRAHPAINDVLGEISGRIEARDHDCYVVVSVVGQIDVQRLVSLAPQITDTVNTGAVGYVPLSRDCILAIARRPTDPRRPGVFAPADFIGQGVNVSARIGIDRFGRPIAGPQMLCSIFVLQANRYAQIRQTFRRANSQVPTGASGVFFIDVELM